MFHCLVINVHCVCLSDSSYSLSHSFLFVKNFFHFFEASFFETVFEVMCRSSKRLVYPITMFFVCQQLFFLFFKLFELFIH